MRKIDRNKVESPKYYRSKTARQSRQMLFDYFDDETKSLSQKRYPERFTPDLITEESSIRQALKNLFSNCCSFCELESQNLEVYRFRPRENASPAKNKSTSHLYYIWLFDVWQNLYLICKDCLPVEENHFPVLGRDRAPLPSQNELYNYLEREDGMWPNHPPKEKPALLDPCNDMISRHLTFDIKGNAVAKTSRARFTIKHFDLNRTNLISSRRHAFSEEIGQLRRELRGESREKQHYSRNDNSHSAALEYFLRSLYREILGKRARSDLISNFNMLKRLPDPVETLDKKVHRLRSLQDNQITQSHDDLYLKDDLPVGIPTSITVKNFKSLENLELKFPRNNDNEKYAPSLLILGENAIGKTTILEAFALCLMRDKARNNLKLRNFSKFVLNPKYLGGQNNLDRPQTANISIEFENKKSRSITFAVNSEGLSIEGPPSNIPVFGYGAFRQYENGHRNYSDHKFVRNLFDSHERLSNPEKWLLSLNKPNFDMVARSLRSVFLVNEEFDVLEREGQQIYVVTKTNDRNSARKMRTPISIVSSGFKSVLATTCEIMQGLMDKRFNPLFNTLADARAIVLIDEVEANLHPRWKMGILGGLRKALPRVSFIATSHDPLCLRSMGQNEVFVLQRVPGHIANSELPVFTEILTELPDNRDWTIEQLLTADFFQLRSTEDMETQRKRAEIEDLIAMGERPSDNAKVRQYLEEFTQKLPIGNTELHRLIQEALADYIDEKRNISKAKLTGLREATKKRILDALRSS